MEVAVIQKYQNKSISTLIATATRVFNAFIRKRDTLGNYFICISCQRAKSLSQMHAGHFYSAGQHSSTRFDENNVHGQCVHCNTYLHGNLADYQKNLEKKIGKGALEELELKVGFEKRSAKKWDRFELIDIIEKFK